jgi:hypothetical protein
VRAAAFAAMVLLLATAEAAWAMPLDLGRAGALSRSAGAAPNVRWLCKPGLADNPCSVSLRTTRFSQAAAWRKL